MKKSKASGFTASSGYTHSDLNANNRGHVAEENSHKTLSLPMMRRAWRRTGAWNNANKALNWKEGAQGWGEAEVRGLNRGGSQWSDMSSFPAAGHSFMNHHSE